MNSDLLYAPEDIQAQLERILASSRFSSAPQLTSFLRFVVEETLAGHEQEIKQYTIAVKAFGRDRRFSPTTDPIVRIQAGRLRRFLARYYREQGAGDAIRIEIPVGTYVPVFRPNAPLSRPDAQLAGSEAQIAKAQAEALPIGPSVVVLPLEVLTDDPEQTYFADGLSEQLAVALMGYPGYVIIGPLSRERLEATPPMPVEELGRRYRAQFVLQGSLRKGGDRVRASLRLVDVNTRGAVWAKTFDSKLSAADLFDFEDAVSNEVAATLVDNFGVITRELGKRPAAERTDSFAAYDAVLRYHHYFTVLTGDAWRKAFDALERAVALDPNYVMTHAMLADMNGAQYHLLGAGDETLTQMERLVTRALQLDSGCQLAHQMRAMAHIFRGRRDLFIAEADWALRINPNNANALASCGLFLAIVGEWERGSKLLQKAMRLNPHYPGWYHLAGFLDLYRTGDYEEAWQAALRISTPGFYLDPLARAAALGQLGRAPEAAETLASLAQLLPESGVGLRAFMRRTLFSDENVDMLLDGLRKSGLDIDD